MNVLPACMFAVYVPGPCEGQKKVSDPLEQELQVAVIHGMDAGN